MPTFVSTFRGNIKKIASTLDVDIKDLFVSTKGKETIYVQREGEYVPIGEIKTE